MKVVRKKEMPTVVFIVGENIKSIIKKKKLKLRHVSYDADLDEANLRKYMKGKQEMKISILVRIASALEVEISELFKN